MLILKNKISTAKFVIVLTVVDMLLYHLPLYKYTISHLDIFSLSGVLTFFSVLVSLFTITAFLLFLILALLPSMAKYLAYFIFIANSIAVYFVNTYGVILDKTMIGNVFNTNTSEATSYYDPKIFLYIVVLGILPSIIISKIKFQ